MCGIAGIFGTLDLEAIRAMIAASTHRGPDDRGFFSDDSASLGHARLSIIDLSPLGHQPMANETEEIWIVFNGEIYNWRSERDLLEQQGRRFRTQSDTEVLLALYERHGEAFVRRLRGIFAFAIYDRRNGPGREKLVLARDQFGIKPLLYSVSASGCIVFASELKAMLASGRVSGAIDPEALRSLLTFGSVCQPRTFLAEVSTLPSAHILVATRANGIRIERYWSYRSNAMPELRDLPYSELLRRGRAIIEESIALQQVADVPVGAFLSGGVDSSLIAALMAGRHSGRLKTFSVGFDGDSAAMDESHGAGETAAYLGTDHTRVVVSGRDARDAIEHFAAGLDQPSVDGLNSYFVSRATAQAVKVTLSGTGSDELFAGYPWFAGMVPTDAGNTRALGRFAGIRRWIRRAGDADSGARTQSFLEQYSRFYQCLGPAGARALLTREYGGTAQRSVAMSEDLAPLDELSNAPVLDRISALCLNGYTRNQLLRDIDACAMSHSLEVRVPFLDPVVADFALSLPQSAKLRPDGFPLEADASYDRSGIKRIIVDVARDFLPAQFFTQRAKRGFGLPFASWMAGPLRDVVEDTLAPDSVRRRGLFDPRAVAEMWRNFDGGHLSWNGPWVLMMIELWCRNVRDKARERPAAMQSDDTRDQYPLASSANTSERISTRRAGRGGRSEIIEELR
jgi:asparagine synthase (glutamine-hydrolysing)